MNKYILISFTALLFVAGQLGVSQASLIYVGQANYNGGTYQLIYDDVQHLIWLDYTHGLSDYNTQIAWADSLNNTEELSCQFFEDFNISWTGDWRLPEAVDGLFERGYDGTTTGGYNIITSELGHLFYESLGNVGRYNTDGSIRSEYGLNNTGTFLYLIKNSNGYGFGTEYAYDSNFQSTWEFSFNTGGQGTISKDVLTYGLAVRSAYLVPLPGTLCLLCIGLIGLAGIRKKGV